MKFLAIVSLLFLSSYSTAQGISILLDGTSDVTNQLVNYNVSSTQEAENLMIEFYVLNSTGSDQDLSIRCDRVTQTNDWTPYFVWGPSGVIGDGFIMSNGNDSIVTYSAAILMDSTGILWTNLYAGTSGGCFTFRYSILDNGGTILAYVDIQTCLTLGLEVGNTSESIPFFPNPASDQLNLIENEAVQSLSIVNQLGKEVLKLDKTIPSLIDVSSLQNGHYVLKFQTTSGKGFVEKLIILK